jgi:hypothetical protein
MKKTAILLLLIAMTVGVSATETRIGGMAGQSPRGFFVVPDAWTDPFYVNPALLVSTESQTIRMDGTFSINPYHYKDNTNYDTRFNNTIIGRMGLIKPLSKIMFAYDGFVTNTVSTTQDIDSGNITSKTVFEQISTGHTFIVAKEFSDTINFGYNGSVSYRFSFDQEQAFGFFDTTTQDITPVDLDLTNRWGFTFDKGRTVFGVNIILDYTHQVNLPSGEFIANQGDWNIWQHTSSGQAGADLLWDISFKPKTKIRLQSRHRAIITQMFQTDKVNSAGAPADLMLQAPQSAAVSFIHPVTDKIQFHYGGDAIVNFMLDISNTPDVSDFDINMTFGLFGGVEVAATEKITIRSGITSSFFTLNYDYTPGPDHYIFLDLPLSLAASLGMDIVVTPRITMQMNLGVVGTDLNFYFNGAGTDSSSSNFSITLSAGLLIK